MAKDPFGNTNGDDDPLDNEWIPEQALRNLNGEQAIYGDETQEQTAQRLLRENLPIATAAIIHLALYSRNEKIRFDASKYVTERTLGPLSAAVQSGDTNELLELVREMTHNP